MHVNMYASFKFDLWNIDYGDQTIGMVNKSVTYKTIAIVGESNEYSQIHM